MSINHRFNTRQLHLTPWVVLVALLLLRAVAMGIDYRLTAESLIEQENVRLAGRVNELDATLSQRLHTTRQALETLGYELSRLRQDEPDSAQLIRRLEILASTMSGIRSIYVVNAEGTVRIATRSLLVGLDLATSERFQTIISKPAAESLYISSPFRIPSGDYTVSLGLAILDEHGQFGGAMYAELDPDYYSSLLDLVLYAPGMRAALIHEDGKLIYAVPGRTDFPGPDLSKLASSPFMRHMNSGNVSSIFDDTGAATDSDRFLAAIRTINITTHSQSGNNLVVLLGRNVDSVLDSLRKELFMRATWFVVFALILSFGLWLYQRRQIEFSRRERQMAHERAASERIIRKNEERLRTALDAANLGVIERDFSTGTMHWSDGARKILDFTQDLTSLPMDAVLPFVHPDDTEKVWGAIRAAVDPASDGTIDVVHRIQRDDGEVRWVKLKGKAYFSDESGQREPLKIVSVLTDITDQKKASENIEYLAYHDVLTGLPNRLLGRDRLDQALAAARRHGYKVAVMQIDLDKFKLVNDTYGHAAGDMLLREVASRLKLCLRADDTLCRLSGDEFMVVVSQVKGDAESAQISERMLRAISTEPFDLDGVHVSSSISVGIAIFPDHDETSDRLMRDADLALYEAKHLGQGQRHLYEMGMNDHLLRYLEIRNGLRCALEECEFELYYQPQIELRTGRLAGAEALIRWNRPGTGVANPADFIAVAEDSGLIMPIGRWVLLEACRQAVKWQAAGFEALNMSVNISAIQFRQEYILQDVQDALTATGLDPSRLELELTESTLLRHDVSIDRILADWKSQGIRISIDDFGTGYSNLAYLKRINVDRIKIDRTFVAAMMHDDRSESIVQAIIGIGRSLGVVTIAEGIEDAAAAERLRDLGCDIVQGFFYSKPLPAADFELWLRSYRSRDTGNPG